MYYQLYTREISKEEFPQEKVRAFYKVRVNNKTSKKVEEGALIHLPTKLIAISLESKDYKAEIKKKLSKSNVVALRDNSAIYFWDDQGLRIERLVMPINSQNSQFLQSIFDPSETLKMLKTTMIGNTEYLV